MTFAWFAIATAVVALLGAGWVLRHLVRGVTVSPGGRCAACGGEPDGQTLHCRSCGGDVRLVGLTPPSVRILSRRGRWLMLTAVAVPIACVFVLPFVGPHATGPQLVLTQPVVATASGPRSAAYAGVRLTVRRQTRLAGQERGDLPGYAILQLIDDGRPAATIVAVRTAGTWLAGRAGGPTLDRGHVARWIADETGAETGLALEEAADVLTLLDGATQPPAIAVRGAQVSTELTEAMGRLRGQELGEAVFEAELDRVRRRVMSGVDLPSFADWTIPSSRGAGGGGFGWTRARQRLQITAAAWLVATVLVLIITVGRGTGRS